MLFLREGVRLMNAVGLLGSDARFINSCVLKVICKLMWAASSLIALGLKRWLGLGRVSVIFSCMMAYS